ncbi:MAG: hypothetical protein ACLFR0_08095 [Alphaproteobacteria bacterium]
MKNSVTALGSAAVLSLGLAFSAQAERINNEGPLVCEGQMFGGDYLAKARNGLPNISADLLNIALGEAKVAAVEDHGAFLQITPINQGDDCNDFMDALESTGLLDYVEPNWVLGFNQPSITF